MISDNNPNITQSKASDPATSAWVSASAGTGKTKVLLDRLIRLLLNGVPLNQILCITYTTVTAKDILNKLLSQTSQWSLIDHNKLKLILKAMLNQEPSAQIIHNAKNIFYQVIEELDKIHISTIHSFCQSILAQFPIEIGIAPNFNISTEEETAELKKQALNNFYNLYNNDKSIAKNLDHLAKHLSVYTFEEYMQTALNQSITLELIRWHHKTDTTFANLRQALFEHLEATQDCDYEMIIKNFMITNTTRYQRAKQFINIVKVHEIALKNTSTDILEQLISHNPDNQAHFIDSWIQIFFTKDNKIRQTIINKSEQNKLSVEEKLFVDQFIKEEIDHIEHFQKKAHNQLTAEINFSCLKIALTINKSYQELKLEHNMLDYNDLLIKTYQLLTTENDTWVSYKIDQKISHILLDEAQDTSSIQWEIISAIFKEFNFGISAQNSHRTIFVVGDVKQAIYSFQGADPYVFQDKKTFLKNQIIASKNSWLQLPMNISFRSAEGIIDFVNAISMKIFDKTNSLYDNEDVHHIPFHKKQPYNVEIWPVIEAQNSQSNDEIYNKLAKKIVEKISIISKERYNLNDMAILYKQKNNVLLNNLIQHLTKANIPISSANRIHIQSNPTIQYILMLLRFVLQPYDDFSLACILKSPFFNLTDKDILQLKGNKRLSIYDTLKQHDSLFNLHKYNNLAHWHELAMHLNAFDFLFHIFYIENYWKNFVNVLGREALEHITEFLNLALTHSGKIDHNLQQFLKAAEKMPELLKPKKENSDGINLRTIHSSKGLEFKVIFLLNDIGAKTSRNILIKNDNTTTPLMFIQDKTIKNKTVKELIKNTEKKELEEYNRLLYVAITRAKNHFYLCSVKKGQADIPKENWLQTIRQSLADTDLNYTTLPNQIWQKSSILQTVEGEKSDIINIQNKPTNYTIPKWINEPINKKINPIYTMYPSKLLDNKDSAKQYEKTWETTSQMRKGIILHKILEKLGNNIQDNKILVDIMLEQEATLLSLNDKQEIKASLATLMNTPEFKFIFQKKGYNEIALAGKIKEDYREILVSGRIDRLVITNNQILIIDYKFAKQNPYKISLHKAQINLYKKILKNIYSNHQILGFLLYTKDPSIIQL